MKTNKPSALLAYAGWISIFVLSWLLLLRIIPSDTIAWTFFGIFFVVAVFASAVQSNKPKKDGITSPDDLVVKMDNAIYTQSNGGLLIGPERPDGKMIVIMQNVNGLHPLNLPQPSQNTGKKAKKPA